MSELSREADTSVIDWMVHCQIIAVLKERESK
jgi:hypothetical protein